MLEAETALADLAAEALLGEEDLEKARGARSRRERRRRAEARLRLMLLRNAQLLASHRGGPVLAEAETSGSTSHEAVLSPWKQS